MTHKKTFKDEINPALQFITETETEAQAEENIKDNNTTMRERKSKRFNALLIPSVYDNITKIAAVRRSSVNDIVNELLQQYAADNEDLIKKYDDFFGGIENK